MEAQGEGQAEDEQGEGEGEAQDGEAEGEGQAGEWQADREPASSSGSSAVGSRRRSQRWAPPGAPEAAVRGQVGSRAASASRPPDAQNEPALDDIYAPRLFGVGAVRKGQLVKIPNEPAGVGPIRLGRR